MYLLDTRKDKELKMDVQVNENDMQTFVSAYMKNRDAYAKVSCAIKRLRLHEELLSYSGPEGDFNIIAADYKKTHSYLDLVKEAAKIGRSICALNRKAKVDPEIGKTFLPHRYYLQDDSLDYDGNKSIGNLFHDSFDIVQYFSELYIVAAERRKQLTAQA